MSVKDLFTKAYACELDAQDKLSHLRSEFYFPKTGDGKAFIYFCGHSLGLQAKLTQAYVGEALRDWAELGVKGHFQAQYPWFNYHELVAAALADLVGAKPEEVVAMNALTVNLHLMLISFYQPEGRRHKILIEEGAFPSDSYALKSQIRYQGYDPETALLQLKADAQTGLISEAAIVECLETHGDEIALVLLPGVQFRSGQVFSIEKITQKAHEYGCRIGFDLAHAVGNILLDLHKHEVDFAVWCHYKYLNAGPGAIGGCFVHEKHHKRLDLPRLAGWWGHDKQSRFAMPENFVPMPGAQAWQLSNPPILQLAALRAALHMFQQAGMRALREKSLRLTAYLEDLLKPVLQKHGRIITPTDAEQRGAQLSLRLARGCTDFMDTLSQRGVLCDFREPDTLRIAPVPLYNSFTDIYDFVSTLKALL